MGDLKTTFEVKNGLLSVDGRVIPLRRGMVMVALLKAGWKGVEGILPLDLVRRAFQLDLRLATLAGF